MGKLKKIIWPIIGSAFLAGTAANADLKDIDFDSYFDGDKQETVVQTESKDKPREESDSCYDPNRNYMAPFVAWTTDRDGDKLPQFQNDKTITDLLAYDYPKGKEGPKPVWVGVSNGRLVIDKDSIKMVHGDLDAYKFSIDTTPDINGDKNRTLSFDANGNPYIDFSKISEDPDEWTDVDFSGNNTIADVYKIVELEACLRDKSKHIETTRYPVVVLNEDTFNRYTRAINITVNAEVERNDEPVKSTRKTRIQEQPDVETEPIRYNDPGFTWKFGAGPGVIHIIDRSSDRRTATGGILNIGGKGVTDRVLLEASAGFYGTPDVSRPDPCDCNFDRDNEFSQNGIRYDARVIGSFGWGINLGIDGSIEGDSHTRKELFQNPENPILWNVVGEEGRDDFKADATLDLIIGNLDSTYILAGAGIGSTDLQGLHYSTDVDDLESLSYRVGLGIQGEDVGFRVDALRSGGENENGKGLLRELEHRYDIDASLSIAKDWYDRKNDVLGTVVFSPYVSFDLNHIKKTDFSQGFGQDTGSQDFNTLEGGLWIQGRF